MSDEHGQRHGDVQDQNDEADQHGLHGQDHDAPPMLVLGERGPDVEDTTLEELRRQREELLREQEAAQERIRAERRQAEAELEAERQRTEEELLERQRRIDDAERDLLAAERRVRRQAQRTGTAHKVPTITRTSTPLPPRGRLRVKGSAGLLAGVVAASALVAIVSAGSPPSEQEIQEYTTLAEGQLAWDEATRAFDDLIVTRMEHAGSVPPDEAVVEIEQQAELVLDLVEEAEGIAPLPFSRSTERVVTAINAIAEDRSPSAVRPVSHWEDHRFEISDMAVGRRDIAEATDTLRPGSALAWWALGAMLLAVLGLGRLAFKDRAYLALALLGVAGITGVASMVFLGTYQQVGELRDHADAREDLSREHRDTSGAQERDLKMIFGLQRSSLFDDDYWVRDWHVDLESVPDDLAQPYLDGRARFADLDADEQPGQAAELVDALEPIWDLRRERVAAASTAVVDAAEEAPSATALVLTSLATAGLAGAALFMPSHRPDTLRTSSARSKGAPAGPRRPQDRRGGGQIRRDTRSARTRRHEGNTARNTAPNTPVRGRSGRRGGR